ncbi:hypothetical protein GEMRC1_008908 [Eukaryota sp. GEM-RC1]
MTITLSYSSQSTAVELVSNDCHLPKLNSGHGCLCPKGMEFNFLGECAKCSLNYYSNSEFNSECRPCSFPRITLQKGSSDLDHCVCPLNTLDSLDACLPCPHLAECGYGNLTGIEPGFRLNTDTWELDECVFWYSCHENVCRSRHAYGDLCHYCTKDAIVGNRIYCIGREYLLFKILLLVLFVLILFVTDRVYIAFLQSKVLSRALRLSISSLSFFRSSQILKHHLNYSNILNIFLFSFSVFSYRRVSFSLIFFEYVSSLFYLDKSMRMLPLIVCSLSLASRFWLTHYFNFKTFNIFHSSFFTGAAFISLNFIFGVTLSHFFSGPEPFLLFIFAFIHILFVVFVIYAQRTLPYCFTIIAYCVIIFSEVLPSLICFIIQTVLLICLYCVSTSLERISLGISSLVCVYNLMVYV